MRRTATTTTAADSLTLCPAGRSAFTLSEQDEAVLTDFLLRVRQVLRRGLHEGHTPAGILDGYSAAVADWPPRRRDAILEAVRAAIAPVPRLGLIPDRLPGDGFGDAA